MTTKVDASSGSYPEIPDNYLDVIISVGYRVKSQQGTRFRQWASQVLRDHIVNGYTVNEHRFREQAEKLADMRRTVELLTRTLTNQELVSQ